MSETKHTVLLSLLVVLTSLTLYLVARVAALELPNEIVPNLLGVVGFFGVVVGVLALSSALSSLAED